MFYVISLMEVGVSVGAGSYSPKTSMHRSVPQM